MHALVTGGGGFLGSGIVRKLLERGDKVAALGRKGYPMQDSRVASIMADVRDREQIFRAVEGRDAVFHAAAVPGIWGDYDEYYTINVEGTRNIIDACRQYGVGRLIYTSSPSVVFGNTDMENVNEDVPYPSTYNCPYPKTKAMAEKLVLDSNGLDGVFTVSLRPHLIWGPGDPHLVPRLIDRAEKGKLIRVGNGKNRVDISYIDNVVDAHLLACDALQPEGPVAGNCYFISDGQPVFLWEWIASLLKALDLPPVRRSISYAAAHRLGAIMEGVFTLLRIKKEPPMTRFLAAQLATSHFFDISRARRDFNYEPGISQEEGMKRLIHYLRLHPGD